MDFNAPRLGFTGGPEEFFVPPAGYQHPPGTILTGDQQGTVLEDKLDRIKWSMLDSPSTAQVIELDADHQPHLRPLFGEPLHALAQEPITYPPRPRMLVDIGIITGWWAWQDEYVERPELLVIENTDRQPITLSQFIIAVYDHVAKVRDLLFEIEDRSPSEDVQLYFLGLSGPERKDAANTDAVFIVEVLSNIDKSNAMMEEWWSKWEQRFAEKYSGRS
ncbi:hypothetical protein GQ44DRAFT_726852 [Phaeosphaeriaceae sp. PMI808]|nr:hypothetical protein GQ44DRAFT_726852 [Phaeosphaeriaceae sp. PMI808]